MPLRAKTSSGRCSRKRPGAISPARFALLLIVDVVLARAAAAGRHSRLAFWAVGLRLSFRPSARSGEIFDLPGMGPTHPATGGRLAVFVTLNSPRQVKVTLTAVDAVNVTLTL